MKALYIGSTTGVTDWKDSIGRSIRTDGCILFLCTAGMAVVSVNMQKSHCAVMNFLSLHQICLFLLKVYRQVLK